MPNKKKVDDRKEYVLSLFEMQRQLEIQRIRLDKLKPCLGGNFIHYAQTKGLFFVYDGLALMGIGNDTHYSDDTSMNYEFSVDWLLTIWIGMPDGDFNKPTKYYDRVKVEMIDYFKNRIDDNY